MNKTKISTNSKASYTTLQKKYGGMYVLMDKPDGNIIVVSKNLEKAFEEAEKKGYNLPAVQYVMPANRIAIYAVKISIHY